MTNIVWRWTYINCDNLTAIFQKKQNKFAFVGKTTDFCNIRENSAYI